VNKTVTLSGWVQVVRDKGGIIYIDLRDRYGITQLILNENATLTEAELLQWQRAKCHDLVKESDWCSVAWIVPLRTNNEVKAWALFLCPIQEELSPYLDGIFLTCEEAIKALKALGAVQTYRK
jgi:hypothetical protein